MMQGDYMPMEHEISICIKMGPSKLGMLKKMMVKKGMMEDEVSDEEKDMPMGVKMMKKEKEAEHGDMGEDLEEASY